MKVFWVSKWLAFGSAITTWRHVEQLKALGVTHVINLRRNRHDNKVRQFKNLWLPFRNDKKPRPAWFYRDALQFYKRAKEKSDCKVFVMCHHGICRSASLTYFFLRTSGFTPARAESVILRVRPCAVICRAYRECGEDFLASHWARKSKSSGKHTKSRRGAST